MHWTQYIQTISNVVFDKPFQKYYMYVFIYVLSNVCASYVIFSKDIISFLDPLLTERYQLNHLRIIDATWIVYGLQTLFLNLDYWFLFNSLNKWTWFRITYSYLMFITYFKKCRICTFSILLRNCIHFDISIFISTLRRLQKLCNLFYMHSKFAIALFLNLDLLNVRKKIAGLDLKKNVSNSVNSLYTTWIIR